MSVIRGLGFICKSFTYRICFSLFRLLHNTLQYIYWTVTGTQGKVVAGSEPENYARSAQVLSIKCRHHLDFLLPYTMADFVCGHERFVEPEYVLRDNVFQFFLEGETAVFAETAPGVQVWRLQYGAFVREASELHAVRLILMPISSMVRLGEKLGPPKQKLCFLFNTARCGSTLLTQMLEHTDKVVSVSEPDALNYLAKKYRDMSDCAELRRLTTSFVNVLCKPVQSPEDNRLFFVKLTAPSVVALPFFYDLYPDASYLFMYRHVHNVSKSIYRITQVMPVLLSTLYAGCFSKTVVAQFFNELGISPKDYAMRYKDLLCMGTSSWCISTRQYLDIRKNGATGVRCLRYEDLVADPTYAMGEILKFCGMPEEWSEKATEALKQDSQKRSVLSQSSKFVAPELTPRRKRNMNEMLKGFGLPQVDDSNVLEGILAYKA